MNEFHAEKLQRKAIAVATSFATALALAFALTFAASFVSCSDTPRSSKEARKALAEQKLGIVDSFASKALSVSVLSEKATRPIQITLPRSYFAKPEKRYPVVYYLHGFGEGPGVMFRNGKYIAKLMADGLIPEMIVVEPDCATSLGGAFYVNSTMAGNYEDYLTKELVAFVDANYRTIPLSAARGLAGFSMGGFGALSRGLRHPDVYGAVYAFAPGVFTPDGLTVAMTAWKDDPRFLTAYSAVFSPTPGGTVPGNIPRFDGSDADNAVIAEWNSGFGDWDKKIGEYAANPAKLAALKIVYGNADEYRFIREGCEYVDVLLVRAGIGHEFSRINSRHELRVSLIVEDILPFFGKNLAPCR